MNEKGKSGSAEHRASSMADFWTRLGSGKILVYEVPQVGRENMAYQDAEGKRGTFPGMISSVCAIDREGTQFRIALFESVEWITVALADHSLRLRRLSAAPPPSRPSGHLNRVGPDYISGT